MTANAEVFRIEVVHPAHPDHDDYLDRLGGEPFDPAATDQGLSRPAREPLRLP
ncbi:hypothetical protein [Saccharopolyspora cebuensis]|uniref:Uncharacterized protein n=1 Tax=Saccharopolyspora cebuensis TaxID=418759 RepID=A0ABV4CDX5_9PSEU